MVFRKPISLSGTQHQFHRKSARRQDTTDTVKRIKIADAKINAELYKDENPVEIEQKLQKIINVFTKTVQITNSLAIFLLRAQD